MLFAEEREPGKIAINLKTQPQKKKKKKYFKTHSQMHWSSGTFPYYLKHV